MTSWEKIINLPEYIIREHIQKVYGDIQTGSSFPFEVRYALSKWLEERPWDELDPDTREHEAYVNALIPSMLSALDEKIRENSSNMIMAMRLQQTKVYMQATYSNNPFELVRVIKQCLEREKNIIQHFEQGTLPGYQAMATEDMSPNQDLDDKFEKLSSRSNQLEMELNQMIDSRQQLVVQFNDFKKKQQQLACLRMNGHPQEELDRYTKDMELQKVSLQNQHTAITREQTGWLNRVKDYFIFAAEIESNVIDEQLANWKRDQQLGGNGGSILGEPVLNKIQVWCDLLASGVYRTHILLKKFTEQTLDRPADTLFATVQDLRERARMFLKEFAQKTFLIEKQPPQVMKTNTRFLSTIRLLCGQALNIHRSAPCVKVSIISEACALKFMLNPAEGLSVNETSGAITNHTSNLDYHESTKQMTANFRNMQLSKIRRTEKKGTESVMDEKFALLFQCHFKLPDDFDFYIWTLSLPVVVIVHGNQEPHAWATVTWDNAFAAPGRNPYVVPDKVAWSQVGEVLSMKFRQYVGRSLTPDALRFLAGKAFRNQCPTGDYDNLPLSWSLFAKEPLPERSFTFWEWFYAILKVTREHMRSLWAEQAMIGFISRSETERLLTSCPLGTFLLRFSDSELGGVTIAWVGESTTEVGVPEVFMVQPFTSKDFAIRGLADRINDLKNLHFLYPNIPKDQVFGKFYSRVNEGPPLANGYVKPWLALTLPGYESKKLALLENLTGARSSSSMLS